MGFSNFQYSPLKEECQNQPPIYNYLFSQFTSIAVSIDVKIAVNISKIPCQFPIILQIKKAVIPLFIESTAIFMRVTGLEPARRGH